MRRFLCVILTAILFVSVMPMRSFASELDREDMVTKFDDGSYMIESIETGVMRTSGSKTGTKTDTYYSSSGQVLWKVVLTGTFTYDGSSSACTASSISTSISDSAWYTISKSATRSGNTAYGTATMGEKVLGVTVSRVPVNLSLSCDKDGNLS